MRVSQISVNYNPSVRPVSNNNVRHSQICKPEQPANAVSFNGKFGAWVGGVVGAVAVVATAIVTAPVVACLAGGGAIVGAIGGSVAEDAVNGDEDKND